MDSFLRKSLEITTTIAGLSTVWIGSRRYIIMWPISILITSVNLFICFDRQLYGIIFKGITSLILSSYGWYHWSKKTSQPSHLQPISRVSKNEIIITFIIGCCYIAILYPIFKKWGSALPLLEAIGNAIFVIAMWTTAHMKLESYFLWGLLNIFSIYIYCGKLLFWFAAKYLVYLLLSFYGYLRWNKDFKRQQEQIIAGK